MQLDIVIPCFNEEVVLKEIHLRVKKILEEVKEKKLIDGYNIIYVDDGSNDGTFEILEKYSQKDQSVKALSFSRNFGHQAALSAGLKFSKGDAVISLDADLQDPPELIETMLQRFHEGFEIVYGVRDDREQDTFFKRTSATCFYKLMLWFGVQIIPHHAEYRLISRQVLEAFKQYGEVNIFIRGIFPIIGFESCKVTYKRDPRFAGKTKYPLKAMLKFGFEGITSFSVIPLRIASVFGAFVCFITLLTSAWGFLTYLLGNTIPGWTSTVLPIYFLGGVQLIFLGLLGEYIGKIFLEVKKRPRYIVRNALSISDKKNKDLFDSNDENDKN
mgnify:FL=1